MAASKAAWKPPARPSAERGGSPAGDPGAWVGTAAGESDGLAFLGPEEEGLDQGKTGIIYSLGTGTRPLEEFIDLLRGYGVSVAADVRSYPSSRRFPHFSRENLQRCLKEKGIAYVWLGESLGGFRRGGYEAYARTGDFHRGMGELEELARLRPTAFFCAERSSLRCHRRFIARALEERGWKVVGLGEERPPVHSAQGTLPLERGE